jgi:hypothetical protein
MPMHGCTGDRKRNPEGVTIMSSYPYYVVIRDAAEPQLVYEAWGYSSLDGATRAAALVPVLPERGVVVEVRAS